MNCDKCFYYEGQEDSYCYMFEFCPEHTECCAYYTENELINESNE
jgi:hypothetical protein